VNMQKVESIVQVTLSTTYSLLMNSSKAAMQATTSKSCLAISTSLCYPKLAFEVMDLIHGSPVLGDSNCQTLSICYPGSVKEFRLTDLLYLSLSKSLAFYRILLS
jgi:hypothetical protein